MRHVKNNPEAAVPATPRILSVITVIVTLLAGTAWLTGAVSVTDSAWAQAQTPAESPDDYPAGEGRDDTFYACTACHGFKLIAAQGMSRPQWDETISLMTSKHNMPKLEGKDRETALNYLESAFPPRRGGFQNPFSRQ
jgi:hypothetical protein